MGSRLQGEECQEDIKGKKASDLEKQAAKGWLRIVRGSM